MKRNTRNTFGYKIRMWFYHLTWADIIRMVTDTRNIAVDIITAIMVLLAIIFFPAFFH